MKKHLIELALAIVLALLPVAAAAQAAPAAPADEATAAPATEATEIADAGEKASSPEGQGSYYEWCFVTDQNIIIYSGQSFTYWNPYWQAHIKLYCNRGTTVIAEIY